MTILFFSNKKIQYKSGLHNNHEYYFFVIFSLWSPFSTYIHLFSSIVMEVETDKTREEEALPRMEEEQCTSEQRINIEEACSLWKISDILLKNLQNEGITEFFEIQTKAIPELINCILARFHFELALGDRCGIARDICISAPTGSGKTLVCLKRIYSKVQILDLCDSYFTSTHESADSPTTSARRSSNKRLGSSGMDSFLMTMI